MKNRFRIGEAGQLVSQTLTRHSVQFIETSAADPGCLSRIPDTTSFHPRSRILIKEFKYFDPKKGKKMVSKL
jgi:hypothetical protein